MKKINVLVKKANQEPTMVETFDYYKNYQELVGGWIETIPMPFNEDVICILNEEGKIYGLEPNIMVDEYQDVFVGTLVFVGNNGEDFRELTEKEIEQTKAYLSCHSI